MGRGKDLLLRELEQAATARDRSPPLWPCPRLPPGHIAPQLERRVGRRPGRDEQDAARGGAEEGGGGGGGGGGPGRFPRAGPPGPRPGGPNADRPRWALPG